MKIGTKLTLSLVIPLIAVMAIDALITISQVRRNLTDEMQKKAEHSDSSSRPETTPSSLLA